jgi:hypothetical protein
MGQIVEEVLDIGAELEDGSVNGQEAVDLHGAAVVVAEEDVPVVAADVDAGDGALRLGDGPDWGR